MNKEVSKEELQEYKKRWGDHPLISTIEALQEQNREQANIIKTFKGLGYEEYLTLRYESGQEIKRLTKELERQQIFINEYEFFIKNIGNPAVKENEQLLKQLGEADRTLEVIANGRVIFPSWEDTVDILIDIRKLAKETRSHIQGKDDEQK